MLAQTLEFFSQAIALKKKSINKLMSNKVHADISPPTAEGKAKPA